MPRQAFTTADELQGPFYHGPRQLFPLIGEGDFNISFEIAKRDGAGPSPTVSLGVLYFTDGVQGSFVPVALDDEVIEHTSVEEYSAVIEFGTADNQVPETATDIILMAKWDNNNLDTYSFYGPLSPTARGAIIRSDQINADAREVINAIVQEQIVELGEARSDITSVSLAGATLNSAFTDYTNTATSRFNDAEARITQSEQTITNNFVSLSSATTDLTSDFNGRVATVNDTLTSLASEDASLSQSITNLTSDFDGRTASVDNQLSALSSEDQSLSQSITNLTSDFNGRSSFVTSQLNALSSEDQSLSQSITQLNAAFDNRQSNVDFTLNSLSDANGVTSQSLTELTQTVDGVETIANQSLSLAQDLDGDLQGQYLVELGTNGLPSLRLFGSNAFSTFNINANAVRHSFNNGVLFESLATGFRISQRAVIGQTSDATITIIDNGMGNDAGLAIWRGSPNNINNPTRSNAISYWADDEIKVGGNILRANGSAVIGTLTSDGAGNILIDGQDPLAAGAGSSVEGYGASSSTSKTNQFIVLHGGGNNRLGNLINIEFDFSYSNTVVSSTTQSAGTTNSTYSVVIQIEHSRRSATTGNFGSWFQVTTRTIVVSRRREVDFEVQGNGQRFAIDTDFARETIVSSSAVGSNTGTRFRATIISHGGHNPSSATRQVMILRSREFPPS